MQLFETDLSLNGLLPMLRALDLETFYDAGRGCGVIDHNLVGADRDGHIGNLVRAIVPDLDRANGWLPVPGWRDDHAWRGMIPFERMPREIDPDRGYIVTANNRLVAEDHPDDLLTDCHPGTRAARVAARIARVKDLSAGDMQDILRDTDSAPARVLVVVLAALLAPLITGGDPNAMAIRDRFAAPSAEYPFGTDNFGRDVLVRVLYGARVPLWIGFTSAMIVALGGALIGMASAWFRRLDTLIMRIMEALLAFPAILLAIGINAALGPQIFSVIIALGVAYIPRMARIVRA